jgi:hypothetical protein
LGGLGSGEFTVTAGSWSEGAAAVWASAGEAVANRYAAAGTARTADEAAAENAFNKALHIEYVLECYPSSLPTERLRSAFHSIKQSMTL